MNGRLNYFLFAKDQLHPVRADQRLTRTSSRRAAPYTIETYCAKHVAAAGRALFLLTSHTHKRGKRFWIDLPDGSLLYESFLYNDPAKQYFDPPLAFDSPIRRSARCATAPPTTTASPRTARPIRRR